MSEVTASPMNPQSLFGLQMDTRAAGNSSPSLYFYCILTIDLTGLVEAWAAGCTWDQLTTATNMDDGDLARLLSRTQDILRQIHMSNYLLEPLKIAAKKARRAMDRQPIRYDIQ